MEETSKEKIQATLQRFSVYFPQCFEYSLFQVLLDLLTHYHTMPHFDARNIYSCGKLCEKRRNGLEQAISPFLTMFFILYGTYVLCTLKCRLQFVSIIDQSKILSSGKNLKDWIYQWFKGGQYEKPFQYSIFRLLPFFKRPERLPQSGTLLTLSLLLTIQEAFLDSVDEDSIAQNEQSDNWSTLPTFSF